MFWSDPRIGAGLPHCPTASTATAATIAPAATAATAPTAAMASPTVLTFDAEGRAVDFDVWVDDLQLFLQCDSRDGVSLFDHTSGVSTTLSATADSTVRSQWTTRDADARLAVSSHLPPAERAHFGQYKTPQSLYDAVVARYSSPPTAALSRLMLPYHFTNLAAFATVADLITHLRTSDARCRAALPTDFCAKNPPPPMRSGLRLLPVRGATTARAGGARMVEGTAGAAAEAVEEVEGVAVEVGVVPGVGASVAASEVVEAAAEVVEAVAAVVVAAAVVLVEVQLRSVADLVVASGSSSRVPVRPHRPNSFVSGTLGVGGLGAIELPRWGDLLRQNVAIFDLDFDAILAAMYALTDSAEGDCYLSVPPDPGIETAALGASASVAPDAGESAAPGAGESALSGTAPTEALHTFTLDSGASRSFFRDSTTLTPLRWPVAVYVADPSGGPVLAHSSTVLPFGCTGPPVEVSGPSISCFPPPQGSDPRIGAGPYTNIAAPSGLLSGLHLPSFSMNLVIGADLQDTWVDQFTPGGQRVNHCTCSRTGRHLATFTRRPGSSQYSLTTTSPPVSASGQVVASSQVFAAASRSSPASTPCSCHPLLHETLLWHHRLGHPSLPRLRGIASRALVSGLPRSLHPLPLGRAPICVPCVEGRQRAAPHSSTFPPIEAPLKTLHMDVWGSARVRGQGHERYFLLVVDDNSRYTTVFPLRSKGEFDRGGEFSSDLFRAFCRAEGICQTFTLPPSPQQNGIAERRIGMVMDVARTSMIHAAAPHFLWLFMVQYATHQINFQLRVSLPETTPTLRWTGKVGDASVFRGPAPSGVSQVDPAEPVEVAVDSGAARGAEPAGVGPGGVEPGGAEPERVESGGAELERVEPRGAESGGVEPGRAEFGGSLATGGAAGAGAAGGAAGAGAAGGTAGAGAAGGAVGAGTGAVSAVSGGAVQPRPYYVPLLLQVLGLPPSPGPPPPVQGLTERRKLASCLVSPVSRFVSPVRTARAGRRVLLPRPPPVPGTHSMILRSSTAPQRVPLPSPPKSPIPDSPHPESASLRAAGPTVTRFLAFAVTEPLFESTVASALVAELVDFAAACPLNYAASLVAESASESVCPLFVGGERSLGKDVLEDRQEEFECFATAVPHLVSMLLAPEGDPDAPDIPTPRSYAEAIEGTYVDEVPPPGANTVSGMWIFRQHGVDFFQTFSPTPKMTTLWVLLHVAAQRDYELHSLDFSTALIQGSQHEEIWVRRPPGFTGSFPAGTQWSLRQPLYGLRQAPREWHDTLRTTLATLGFAPSTADPSLFLCTDTALPLFYVLLYVEDLVFATADTEALAHVKFELQRRHTCTDLEPSGPYADLVGCLMYLMTCTRPDLAYPLSLLARYVALGRHRKGYTFSLGSGSVSWRSTRSSVLSSNCEAEIYPGAMAAQELRWLTYLLTDLGEAPRSPPVLYVDNKAMLALCQEHRLEH
ncbi:unnamed protein product [Closterium sp. NIES-53]